MGDIEIKVKAIMAMVEVLGNYEQRVLLPEGTNAAAFLKLMEYRYGEPFIQLLKKHEAVNGNRGVLFFLNGRDINFYSGMETILEDGDEFFFFMPAGGG